MTKWIWGLGLFVVAIASVVTAKENPFDTVAEKLRQGHVNGLLNEFSEEPQMMAQLYVNLGRPDKAYEILQRFSKYGYCETDLDYKKIPGKSVVKGELKKHRIIMLNENHFNPASRAILAHWLPWLKEQGFTHIGFEAYTPAEKRVNNFYTQDPIMSNLVQKADRLGFKIFGYEAEKSSPESFGFVERFEFRDKQQAVNIAEQIKTAPVGSKFVIFAGWGHIAEAPLQGPKLKPYRVMGDFLNNTYGYDPLSVDTTACNYDGHEENPLANYAYLEDGDMVNVGSVQHVDIQLRLPMAPANEPGYFRKLLGQAYLPETEQWADGAAIILQAYNQETGFIADRVMSEAGEKLPLYLSEGKYHVTLHDLDGYLLWEGEINLKE